MNAFNSSNGNSPAPNLDSDPLYVDDFVAAMGDEEFNRLNAQLLEMDPAEAQHAGDGSEAHLQAAEDSRATEIEAGDSNDNPADGEDGDEIDLEDLDTQEGDIGGTDPGVLPPSSLPPQSMAFPSFPQNTQITGQTSVYQTQQGVNQNQNSHAQHGGGQVLPPQGPQTIGQNHFSHGQQIAAQSFGPQGPLPAAQSSVPQTQQTGLGTQVQPPQWDNSISNINQARTWIAANPNSNSLEMVHANPDGDDVATEYSRTLHHAQNLYRAIFLPPSSAPSKFTASQRIYFDVYQASGESDVEALLSTSNGCKRAQGFLLVLVEDAVELHRPGGPGIPKSSSSNKHDSKSKFTERITHMASCLRIKRVAEDIISGNLDIIAKLVQEPQKLRRAREDCTRTNANRAVNTEALKTSSGSKQNRKRTASAQQTPNDTPTPAGSHANSMLGSQLPTMGHGNGSNGVRPQKKRQREIEQDSFNDSTPSRAPKRRPGDVWSTQRAHLEVGQAAPTFIHPQHTGLNVAPGYDDSPVPTDGPTYDYYPSHPTPVRGFDPPYPATTPAPNGTTYDDYPSHSASFQGSDPSYPAPAPYGYHPDYYGNPPQMGSGAQGGSFQVSAGAPDELQFNNGQFNNGGFAQHSEWYDPRLQQQGHNQGGSQGGYGGRPVDADQLVWELRNSTTAQNQVQDEEGDEVAEGEDIDEDDDAVNRGDRAHGQGPGRYGSG